MEAIVVVLLSLLPLSLLSTPSERDRITHLAQVTAQEAIKEPFWFPQSEQDANAPETASAILLWSIAYHESGLLESVQHCRVTGDRGQSVSVFQLIHGPNWQGFSKQEICSDDALQARLAADILRASARRCDHNCSSKFLLNSYGTGDGSKESGETPGAGTRGIRAIFQHWFQRANLTYRNNQVGWRRQPGLTSGK